MGSVRRAEISDVAVMRFSPGLGSHRELRVDVAAVAGVAAGSGAAVAILTQASAAAAIAVIGLALTVVTLRRPNPWLGTPNDLTTLSLSDDDLDACFAAALRSGTGREPSETEVVLDSVTLLLPGRRWRAPDVPMVRFRVPEPDGGWRIVTFDRPPPRPSPGEVGADGWHGVGIVTDPPWRLDASWRQLVTLSWLRMRPFVGTVVLEPLPGSPGWQRQWEISYLPADPMHQGESTSFRLRSTNWYLPERTSLLRRGADAGVEGRSPGSPADGVQPCGNCGMSFSATARFCRRCGSRQGG